MEITRRKLPEDPLQKDVLHLNFNEMVLPEQMLTFLMQSVGSRQSRALEVLQSKILEVIPL